MNHAHKEVSQLNQTMDVRALDVTKKHMLSYGYDKIEQADQTMIDELGGSLEEDQKDEPEEIMT